MLTRSQELAEAIAGVRPQEIGPETMAKARLCLLDFLGCAFAGVDAPTSRQAIAIAAHARTNHIIGTERTSTPGDAAFANAVLGHGLLFDDMHAASITHHGVAYWPVLLALAEETPVSGRDVLTAAIVAYEVGARLGRLLVDARVSTVFRATGVLTPIGAVAGGSKLRGLTKDQTASAIALVANTVSGLNQWPVSGASDMFFHPGSAARNALTAIWLAEAGAFGSPDILEGAAGLFAAIGHPAMPEPIALAPDRETEIMSVYHKSAPACHFAQTPCQAALRLVENLGPDATRVETIRIAVSEAAATYPGCNSNGPFHRTLQARMSIPFGVAAVFAHRRLSEENYSRLDDPAVTRLLSRTQLAASEELTAGFPKFQGATIEASLEGGRRVSITQRDLIPATEAEVRERFRAAAGAVLGAARADQIEAFVDGFDQQANAGRLLRLCARRDKTRIRNRPEQRRPGPALHQSASPMG